MPQSDLSHPPPAKPAMDNGVKDLQVIVHAMNVERASKENGIPSIFSDSYKALFAVQDTSNLVLFEMFTLANSA